MILSACGAKGDLYQIEEPKVEQKMTIKTPQKSDENPKRNQNNVS